MKSRISGKISLIAFLIFSLFAILAGRLWQLQVVKGNFYAQASIENRLRLEKIPSTEPKELASLLREREGWLNPSLYQRIQETDGWLKLDSLPGYTVRSAGELDLKSIRLPEPLLQVAQGG